jgi:hypothetical protein
VVFSAMLVQVASAAHARSCEQQLCLPQVSHVVSPAAGGQEPVVPPLLLPLLLLLVVMPHAVAQLFSPQVARAPNAVSEVSHSVQLPSVSQSLSQVTQVASSLQAVAWGQQLCARHMAQVEVAVMAGHEPPPLEVLPVLLVLPELEQLPDDEPPPMPPMPPPIPPPDDPHVLLPPLEEEHPKTANAAATAHAPKRPRTRFIGDALPVALGAQRFRVPRALALPQPPRLLAFPLRSGGGRITCAKSAGRVDKGPDS